ncbi:MAG: VOC family protein [Anaerolineae bacterium]|nr:VOC family protein [Anaerolineae bacterium]
MTTVQGVAEAVLYVDDLAAATAFYRDVLGLPVTLTFSDTSFLQAGPHSSLILFDREQLRVRRSAIPHHGTVGPGHVALSMEYDCVDEWRQRLQRHGIAIEHEQRWPQGTYSLYFRDPAGNSVELIDDRHYPQLWERLMAGES